ncbi:hypothetical protein P692DRAFT_201808035 [Suillus brevipes Sb2]|nr:hypothetical protein P692DRAFT_201808035 [Suillus brevipes Sb2]
MFHHEFLAASGIFFAHLVMLLVKIKTIEEKVPHSRLFLVEQLEVNKCPDVVTSTPLSKVHLGDTVRHSAAYPSPSSDKLCQPWIVEGKERSVSNVGAVLSIAVTSGKEVLLKDFRVTNTEISPYDTEQVSITLSRYGLSIWDVAAQEWRKPDGQIVLVLYKYKK